MPRKPEPQSAWLPSEQSRTGANAYERSRTLTCARSHPATNSAQLTTRNFHYAHFSSPTSTGSNPSQSKPLQPCPTCIFHSKSRGQRTPAEVVRTLTNAYGRLRDMECSKSRPRTRTNGYLRRFTPFQSGYQQPCHLFSL